MSPSALGHPEVMGRPTGPQGILVSNGARGPGIPPLAGAMTATALLVEATKEIDLGSPLTIFAPQAVRALLNSHYTQHLPVSHLTCCEVLSSVNCSSRNCRVGITLISSPDTDAAPQHCLTPESHLPPPR